MTESGGMESSDATDEVAASGGAGSTGGVGGTSALSGTLTADEQACQALTGQAFLVEVRPVANDAGVADEWTGDGSFTGVVEEQSSTLVNSRGLGFAPRDEAYALRLRNEEQAIDLVLALPWTTPIADVGDTLSVRYLLHTNTWLSTWGFVEVRNAAGDLIVWITRSHAGLNELNSPPELRFAESASACTFDESCGMHELRGLHATAGSAEVDLSFGAMADVGDYVLLHGDNTDFTFTGGCTDIGSIHAISIAAIRGSQKSLTARDRGDCGAGPCATHEYCEIPSDAACDAMSTSASCSDAPEVCELDCPGVCGCDGSFYCNACRAAQTGVDVDEGNTECMAQPCTGEWSGAGTCFREWSCFEHDYQFDCQTVGALRRCRCSVDQREISSIDLSDPACASAAAACGFPEWHP